MLSGSFPIFALSNHTTFSQTQTGVTVPLSFNFNRNVHMESTGLGVLSSKGPRSPPLPPQNLNWEVH